MKISMESTDNDMKGYPIRCGKISYINVLPLYYPLMSGEITHQFHFTHAPPSQLNIQLRNGMLDISPISSVEYIAYASQYALLPNLSISCSGKVMSVLLFSHLPIEMLDMQTIAMTEESNTSVLLLRVLLAEYYEIRPQYVAISDALSYTACLRIGDSALREQIKGEYPYVYDLGVLWYQWTGLPFVFAVWAIPHISHYNVDELVTPFYRAREWSEANMDTIYDSAKEISGLTDKHLKEYYTCLQYSLGVREQEAMRYFIELLYKYRYITERPNLYVV